MSYETKPVVKIFFDAKEKFLFEQSFNKWLLTYRMPISNNGEINSKSFNDAINKFMAETNTKLPTYLFNIKQKRVNK